MVTSADEGALDGPAETGTVGSVRDRVRAGVGCSVADADGAAVEVPTAGTAGSVRERIRVLVGGVALGVVVIGVEDFTPKGAVPIKVEPSTGAATAAPTPIAGVEGRDRLGPTGTAASGRSRATRLCAASTAWQRGHWYEWLRSCAGITSFCPHWGQKSSISSLSRAGPPAGVGIAPSSLHSRAGSSPEGLIRRIRRIGRLVADGSTMNVVCADGRAPEAAAFSPSPGRPSPAPSPSRRSPTWDPAPSPATPSCTGCDAGRRAARSARGG